MIANSSELIREDLRKLKDALLSNDLNEIKARLKLYCWHPHEFTEAQEACKIIDDIAQTAPDIFSDLRTVRLALIGGMTTTFFIPILRTCALARGILLDITEFSYNSFEAEILAANSDFSQTSFQSLMLLPVAEHLEAVAVDELPNEIRRWKNMWTMASRKPELKIVHLLYEETEGTDNLPRHRLYGQRRQAIAELNQRLIEGAPQNVSFVDFEGLLSEYGRQSMKSPKYWTIAKQSIETSHIAQFCRHLVGALAEQYGLSKRCLVTDLDNTIWGGVLGDDGIHGIRTGQGDAESESYLNFQKYLKQLSVNGLLLAIISKNDEEYVRKAFLERRPDMALDWDAFVTTRIGWKNKAECLQSISEELALPLEHFVFVDDSPQERALVRAYFPQVVVPEMTDVTNYRRDLERLVLFEQLRLTKEDLSRTDSYRSRRKVQDLKTSSLSLDDFLRDLQMTLEVSPLTPKNLGRAAQLSAKTNQFNLTTIRHSEEDLKQFIKDPDYHPFCFRLKDRFTDHGWVGLVVLRQKQGVLEIVSWVMSCRVFGKTLEHSIMKEIQHIALRIGCEQISAQYIPTERNRIVSGLYESFGFKKTMSDSAKSLFTISPNDVKLGELFIKNEATNGSLA